MSQQDGSWNEDGAPSSDGDQRSFTPPTQSLGQGYAEQTGAAAYGNDTAAGEQAGRPAPQSAQGYADAPWAQQGTDTTAWYEQPAGPRYGQSAVQSPPAQAGPQPGQEPEPHRFGQQAQRFSAGAGAVASGAGRGIGDLFSDLQFKRSLTERLASIVFLGVIVWAVLRFISDLVYNFGSDSIGGLPGSLRHMGTGTAIITTITQLVSLVVVIIVARLLLELAIHVARIAHRRD